MRVRCLAREVIAPDHPNKPFSYNEGDVVDVTSYPELQRLMTLDTIEWIDQPMGVTPKPVPGAPPRKRRGRPPKNPAA